MARRKILPVLALTEQLPKLVIANLSAPPRRADASLFEGFRDLSCCRCINSRAPAKAKFICVQQGTDDPDILRLARLTT
jgi:hypothetical protein